MTRNPRLVPDTPDDGLLDAVVVGGSQAGLAMAWHLAQQGLRFIEPHDPLRREAAIENPPRRMSLRVTS